MIILAAVAAISLSLAAVMDKPGQRVSNRTAEERLRLGCEVTTMWLKANAQQRMVDVGELANFSKLSKVLASVKAESAVTASVNQTARGHITPYIEGPGVDVILLTDSIGRVVARAGFSAEKNSISGDSLQGKPLIRDALLGFWGEDVWEIGGQLYLMAGAPVVHRSGDFRYVGSVAIGRLVSQEFAKKIVSGVGLQVSAYSELETGKFSSLVSSSPISVKEAALNKLIDAMPKNELWQQDCSKNAIARLKDSGNSRQLLLASRFPAGSELGMQRGFLLFKANAPGEVGFLGTVKKLTSNDISGFLLVLLGLGMLLAIVIGLALLFWEVDRPLKALTEDALRLSKDDAGLAGLQEEQHKGRFGSIARTVNLYIEKIRRTKESSSQSLDQLLGSGSIGGGGAFAQSVKPEPSAPHPSEFQFGGTSSNPKASPPPSDFNFNDPSSSSSGYDLGLGATQDSEVAPLFETEATQMKASVHAPPMPPSPSSIDDDPFADFGTVDSGHEEIYQQFMEMRRNLGEPTDSPSYDQFVAKLTRNEQKLKEKHNCRAVKFTVYEKGGRAALKASPIK